MNSNELKAQLVLNGKTTLDYSKALGISRSALYRKLKGRTDFSREEIQKTISFLELTSEKAMNIFFAN